MTGRFDDLSAGLAELGCEALLVLARSSQDPDLAPFAGAAHLGDCYLIAPRSSQEARAHLAYLTPMERDEAAATGLALLSPESLDLIRWVSESPEAADFMAGTVAKALELAGVAPGRVALAGHGQAGVIVEACSQLMAKGWTFVSGNGLILALRKRKTDAEVAAIRTAAAGTCAAFRTVADLLAASVPQGDGSLWLEGEPLCVARLRDEVAGVMADHGLDQPKGNIIAPAEEGGVPHSSGTPERVLRAGESLIVDLFPRGTLWADCTRTFCVGTPAEPLARAHAAVLAALETAHLRAAPGVRGWDLQEEVCTLFDRGGYLTQISSPGTTVGYVHNLGHGVGYDLHEQPIFKKVAGAKGILREGDVFTLEPGLYEPEQGWGVRLEDLVYLGPDGLENLTPLPYDLDPGAWE